MPPQTSSPYVTASFMLQFAVAALLSLAAYFTQSTITRLDDSLRRLDNRMAGIEAQHHAIETTLARVLPDHETQLWRPTQPPINQRRSSPK